MPYYVTTTIPYVNARPHLGFVLEAAQYLRADSSLTVTDFSIAFFVVALVSGVSVFTYLRLPADAGAEVSGKTATAVER